MIPKRLFTTWICDRERNPYRESDRARFARSLDSWLRLMPDYEIVVVTSANILRLGGDDWIRTQLADGNFIGAYQWVILEWMHRLGGIFLDMDVEAVKPFDELLGEKFFAGHEGGDDYANNAITGAEANHPMLVEQMRRLKRLDTSHPEFGNNSGPRLLTEMLAERGWHRRNETWRSDDLTVFKSDVLYPYFWRDRFTPECVTPDTVAIHHWASSWDQH